MTVTERASRATPAWLTAGQLAEGAPPLPRRRLRRPGLFAAGVLLTVSGLVAGGGLAAQLSAAGTDVLVLARPVPAGATLSDADLSAVRVKGEGLRGVAARDRSRVVGLTARHTLEAGVLLSPNAVSSSPALAAGQVLIAVTLPAGRLPAEAVTGSRVALYRVAGQGGLDRQVIAAAAVIAEVTSAAESDAARVTLRVPAEVALAVSDAAQADALALAVLAAA